MDSARIKTLQALASEVRKDIVRMVGVARSGSIETPLSVTDVLTYLYWEVMIIQPRDYRRKDRDRFLLGLGDAVPALYAVLARRGYFDREELWHYKRLGSVLQPLPDFSRVPGIDGPCVESASEIAVASGLAAILSVESFDSRVFCLIDINDCLHPDFWSEVEVIGKKGLRGITLLLVNQLNDYEEEKQTLAEYAKSFTEKGWHAHFADGHDFADMERVFVRLDDKDRMPKAIFISTLTGKGLSLPESRQFRNSKMLSVQEMDRALEELENGR